MPSRRATSLEWEPVRKSERKSTLSGCDHRGQPSITSRSLRIKCGPARAIRSKRPFRPSSSRKGGRVMARIRRSRKTFPSIFPSKQSFPHQTEIWRASLRKGLKECLTRSNGISFCYRLCDHSSEDLSEDCGHNGTLEWHCGPTHLQIPCCSPVHRS